jgi:carboxymethylenebutenolidase
VTEKDVKVTTPDGVADAALYYPDGAGSWPAVLLWTDNQSLRPVFRDMGRRLAGEGYVVLVPNVYYRFKRTTEVAGPFNFGTPEDRANTAAGRPTAEGTDKDAVAFLAYLDAQPQTNKAKKAGVQGYCMGGPLSFRTAAAVPNRIAAVATFHGGGLASDQPSSPHLLVPKTKAEYAVLIADGDDQRDPAAKDKLKAAFAAAKLPAKVEVYAGCAHGWTVKGSQAYNEAGAEKAWAEMLALYKRTLV